MSTLFATDQSEMTMNVFARDNGWPMDVYIPILGSWWNKQLSRNFGLILGLIHIFIFVCFLFFLLLTTLRSCPPMMPGLNSGYIHSPRQFSASVLDCPQPSFFRTFLRSLNVGRESRENWTPAKRGARKFIFNIIFLYFFFCVKNGGCKQSLPVPCLHSRDTHPPLA